MAATDARPVPRKNVAFRFYFAIRKPSDSTLITTWVGQDSEVSLDGAAYSDCTNEATEVGTSGTGYIDLTAAEMNADCVVLKVTITNTGAVPLVFVLYPEEAGDYRADVVQFGGTNLTAASGIPEVKVASIATDAVNAAALAANAVTEIQNGLATATNVADAQTAIVAQIAANETKIDSIQSDTNDIQSRLPAALEGGRIAAALDSASLRRFVTEDTGETAAASGSVAKLAQGTGSLSAEQQEQLDLIEVACRGGQVVATTGFGIPDASGALLLKRGHTATITFTSATSNIVTDLSGSGKKVFFGVRTVSGNLLISGVQGEVLVATGLQSVRFTLTASQALALVAGVHLYDVVCVYGYDSNLDPPYASMEPFTGGYVRVQEVGVDLAEL